MRSKTRKIVEEMKEKKTQEETKQVRGEREDLRLETLAALGTLVRLCRSLVLACRSSLSLSG